jgi:hypothetical protein
MSHKVNIGLASALDKLERYQQGCMKRILMPGRHIADPSLIVRWLRAGRREVLPAAPLDPMAGLVGDKWASRGVMMRRKELWAIAEATIV